MDQHVVMFSGGIGSWAAAKRVAAANGSERLTLLFADTLIEDQDLYRFLDEAAANVGGELVRIADGRTPWQVFRDERFIGRSGAGICSKILKQELADRRLRENRNPADTVVYVGMDWSEGDRFPRLAEKRLPWRYEAPLYDPPYLLKPDLFLWLEREGIKRPRLYQMGFSHNNCGGFCCKAGQGHFAHLLRTLPDVYSHHENEEEEMRRYLGRDDISMLRERRGGLTHPLTLRQLRGRIESGYQPDLFDIGGCGCFTGDEGE